MTAVTSVGRASGLEPFVGLGLDSLAEEALYRRNAGRVFGFCLSRLGRREDAEDAVQTTFLQAMRSLRRGVVPLVESAWLLGIARNVCRERWETAGRRSRLESFCDPEELDLENSAPEARCEELIGLEDALRRLPDQQRRAILLRDWRGLSYDEVAEQLGVSHAAVGTLIFRGRRTLAELLRDEPQQTRRRLASLGNLGSLVTAVKTAFTGAAAVAKVAAALSVTAVAIGGAGVAITSPSSHRSEPPAIQAPAIPLQAPVSANVRVQRSPAPETAASPRNTRTAPSAGTAPTRIDAPVKVEATGTTSTAAASRPPLPVPAPPARTPEPASSSPTTPVVSEIPPVAAPVEAMIAGVVAETVDAPAVTETVSAAIETLPPAPVTLPAPVPVTLPAPVPAPVPVPVPVTLPVPVPPIPPVPLP